MAQLYFRYGAMGCGKTMQLLQVAFNYEERGQKVCVIKPATDTKNGDKLLTRIGPERETNFTFTKHDNIYNKIKHEYRDVACVLCDESQFMTPKQADQLMKVVTTLDIPVMCYGLRLNFRQQDGGFEGATRLLQIAHKVEELKTICDVCVTSSSAVKIVKQMPEKNILFIPDCNLGDYVAKQLPEKNIKLLQGGCPVHASVNAEEVVEAKKLHPNALVLVHPECTPDVVKLADYVGSTSGIMDFARKSDAKEFIIGTEISIAEHLQYECPDKMFYYMSPKLICKNMKLSTLGDVYNAILGRAGEEIVLDDETITAARRCIDEMIRLGG